MKQIEMQAEPNYFNLITEAQVYLLSDIERGWI